MVGPANPDATNPSPVPVVISNTDVPLPVVLASRTLGNVLGTDAIRSSPYISLLFLAIYFLWSQLDERDKRKDETVKSVAASHAEAVKSIVETNAQTLKDSANTFERQQALTKELLLERVNRQGKRVEAVERAVGQLIP